MAAFSFHRRQTRRWWYVGATLVAAALFSVLFVGGAAAKPTPPQPAGPYQVPVGPIGVGSGFADNEGSTQTQTSGNYSPAAAVDPNAPATQPTFDWNSLAANPSYGDTSADPYGEATGTTTDWQWVALNDAAASTTDTGFAGGTKQDTSCASVNGSKAPNKDDLKRAYIAFKTLANGHTILNLAWVRIPQNTTSASAHIGFEFNQSTTACGSGSDGLVQRTAGDLLLVYDFTGGSTVPPTINLSRWVTGPADTCQVGSDSPTPNGCWGTFTALDRTQAEANVDTGLNHICLSTTSTTSCGPGESDHNIANTAGTKYVLPFKTTDHLAPTSDDNLGTSEFGEAGVDLTNAGVFTAGSCESFGRTYAVSRSSGDSNTAAMEDLVGPGRIHLSNCTSSATTQMQSSSDNAVAVPFANMSNGDTLSSGTYVRDKSTVTVTGTSTWAGNVDFYLCYNASTTLTGCDSTGTNNPADTSVTQIGGDVGVSNSSTTATSDSTQLSASGSYCWAAEFTSTSPTGLPDATATTTECFSATSPTSIATNPWFYPQDRTVISATSGGDLAGSVKFRLFDNSTDCNATTPSDTVGTGGLLFREVDSVSGASAQTVDTSNSSYRVHADTATDLYWLITYHSTNGNQTDSSSVCVENMGATITADGTFSFG